MKCLKKSPDHNPNYLAKVVKIDRLRKHGNADRLQIATVDFQDCILGLETQEGDLYVYFPVESQLDRELVRSINGFREATLNADTGKTGFFEETCRVKAIKLRGEKSMGFLLPLSDFCAFAGCELGEEHVGQEFDMVGETTVVRKYVLLTKKPGRHNVPKESSILVDGQVRLHVDTENLRKNMHRIQLNDLVSITYKEHGTSWWVANVLTKRKLSLWEKVAKFFGAAVMETRYGIIYGSRKVIKNAYGTERGAGWYGEDVWGTIAEKIKDCVPKGYTLYGEAVGFTPSGNAIQEGYDYGCLKGEMKLTVYRITHTTPDGLVTELSYPEIKSFCEKTGLRYPHLFHYGPVRLLVDDLGENWRESLVQWLESEYNDKDCFMCVNKVPEEGIVLRKENLFACESYKLKSFRFLVNESKQLDKETASLGDEDS